MTTEEIYSIDNSRTSDREQTSRKLLWWVHYEASILPSSQGCGCLCSDFTIPTG
jgi:hypothetical protein